MMIQVYVSQEANKVPTFLDRAKNFVGGSNDDSPPKIKDLGEYDGKNFKDEVGRTYANRKWWDKKKFKTTKYRAVDITEFTNAMDAAKKVLEQHVAELSEAEKRYSGQGKKPLKEFMESVHPMVFSRDIKKQLPTDRGEQELKSADEAADVGKQLIIIHGVMMEMMEMTKKFNLGNVNLGNISKIEAEAFYAKASKRTDDFFKAAKRFSDEVIKAIEDHLEGLRKAA